MDDAKGEFYRKYSGPVETATLRVLSLGAGVQSSVLALLAARDMISPKPDYAIFADTRWEAPSLYDHLAWLETELPFPVLRVSAGDLERNVREGVNSTGRRYVSVPFYTEKGGIGRRQCTAEYKIKPIQTELRRLLGVRKGCRVPNDVTVELWLGISTDEIQRMKASNLGWITHRWPLLEQGLSRKDCEAWFRVHYPGRPLARSACLGCPFRKDQEWVAMKRNDPGSFDSVVTLDETLRRGGERFRERMFVHASRRPIADVDLDGVDSPEKQWGFLQECDGLCGT